jgi:hypothetical protein
MLAGDIKESKERDNERGVNEPTDSDYPWENVHCPAIGYVVAECQN